MRKITPFVFLLFSLNIFSQKGIVKDKKLDKTIGLDQRPQKQKDDPNDSYNQNSITKLDLIEALDLASIRIHKFKLGNFDKKLKLQIFAEEYLNGKLIQTDTLLNYDNAYYYYIDGKQYTGFIDQLKFFSKTEKNNSELVIKTYATSTKRTINLENKRPVQFYNWREYENTEWELDKQIPLMVFASSWWDNKNSIERFCGVVKLNDNEEGTKELMTSSQNYIVISFKISEMGQ